MEDRVTKTLNKSGHDHRFSCDVPQMSHSSCPGNCTAMFDLYDQKVKEGELLLQAPGSMLLKLFWENGV